ncbi:MAG: PSD1 domain-containing protein, partial [Planctomycetaceae bacterium]|nr:PSD1 domain-containing protein [Planctomycetaceae bacterium]
MTSSRTTNRSARTGFSRRGDASPESVCGYNSRIQPRRPGPGSQTPGGLASGDSNNRILTVIGNHRGSRNRFCVLLSALCVVIAVQSVVSCRADDGARFEAEVAPLLIRRCVECHQGPDPSGGLNLTSAEGLTAGGDSGATIDLSAVESSHLLERILNGDMPPQKQGRSQKLPAEEIAVLQEWVRSGAVWPEGRTLDLFERTNDVRGGRDWWSLQPVKKPALPEDALSSSRNPVDAFIQQSLSAHQMTMAPPADRRTLLRRLYYDLIGLPPGKEEIDEFVRDSSPDALETRIEKLLAMPQYGERWARYWLDLVRYADTSGYERDQEKPYAWKYRDWVVQAFNEDLPYQTFILHQLAGDEISDRDEQSVVATGFLRLGTWNDEPNDPADYQYDRLEDMVHTTSSAFLAMTVKCARCHAHKFDPLTQDDYYRMASAFWAGPISEQNRDLLGGPSPEKLGFAEVLGWTDLSPDPPPLQVLKNGERSHPLHAVVPGTLSAIPSLQHAFDRPPAGAATSLRRLQLAKWIADPRNPLTHRVLVNRLWQHHFGQAIVRTPNNFGFLADPPTHPELLDWLAAEFVEHGGSIKHIHRLILTSQAWQQASLHPRQQEYQVRDPGNRLWWHSERRRLDAEALRDSILMATGELDLSTGGPGFRPTISSEALEGLSRKSS